MKCTPFRAAVLVISVFSLGFQLCGLFVPAWYRVFTTTVIDARSRELSVNIGLWTARMCLDVDMTESICVFELIENVEQHLNSNVDIRGLLVLRILTVVGGILSLVGMLMTLLHFWQADKDHGVRTYGVIGSVCWGIGAIAVLVAVVIHVHQYMSLREQLKENKFVEIFLPWAVILSGCGTFLAIVASLSMAIRICQHSHYHHAGYYAHYQP